MKKRNNFIIEFARYKEFVNEAKQDKTIKPLLSFDYVSQKYFASKFFKPTTITNHFKAVIICENQVNN